MIIVAILLGLLLAVVCGGGILWLIGTIFTGIITANWLMVIGGGILAYLMLGLLIIGLVVGIYLFFGGLFND